MTPPRRLKDTPATLPEFRQLMNSAAGATLPCADGEEWFSPDPRLQARAAALCGACAILQVCRSFAIAAAPAAGVWGGTTPRDRRRIRRRKAAA